MKPTRVISFAALYVMCGATVFFFVTTSFYNQKRGMEISFQPRRGWGYPAPPGCIKNVITVVLSKDSRVFYYMGSSSEYEPPISVVAFFGRKNRVPKNECDEIPFADILNLIETKLSYESGIADFLLEKNVEATAAMRALDEERKANPMHDTVYKKRITSINSRHSAVTIIIKSDNQARYGDVVKLVDILRTLKISKYFFADLTSAEQKALNQALAKQSPK